MSLERQHPANAASRPEGADHRLRNEALESHPGNHNLHTAALHHDDHKHNFPSGKVSPEGHLDFGPAHPPGEKAGHGQASAGHDSRPTETRTTNPDGSRTTQAKDGKIYLSNTARCFTDRSVDE